MFRKGESYVLEHIVKMFRLQGAKKAPQRNLKNLSREETVRLLTEKSIKILLERTDWPQAYSCCFDIPGTRNCGILKVAPLSLGADDWHFMAGAYREGTDKLYAEWYPGHGPLSRILDLLKHPGIVDEIVESVLKMSDSVDKGE